MNKLVEKIKQAIDPCKSISTWEFYKNSILFCRMGICGSNDISCLWEKIDYLNKSFWKN